MKKLYIMALGLALTACNGRPDYDATGIFEATTVMVAAETAGKILTFNIEEGDSVVAGSEVALIDTVLLSLQRSQVLNQQRAAENSRPDIAAQAAALRSQIAHAEHEWQRQKNLLASGATTQKNYDDAEANLRSLRAQIQGLLSNLDNNRTSLSDNALALQYQAEQIAEQMAKCRIASPVSGTVLVKYAEAGEYAVPGKPLYKIADLDNIYLRSYFTANQLANLSIGQHVTVIADFGGDEQYDYPGTITWIAEESEFTPKSIQTNDTRANLVYAVKIAVHNDGRLKLGQYGEVKL